MTGSVTRVSGLVVSALVVSSCFTDANKGKIRYLKSAEQYSAKGNYQSAIIQLRNAIQLDPRYTAAHYELAQTYLRVGNRDAAFGEFQSTVALDPRNSDAQLQLASLLIARKQYDAAQATATKVLEAYPQSASAHATLGEKYAMTRDTAKAIPEFQRAIALDPTRFEYYASLAALRLSSGEPSAAAEVYQEAITRNPNSAEARVGLGQFYFSQGKLREAETQMLAASQVNSHDVVPRILLARTYVAMGKLTDAETVNRSLKMIAPDDPRAYQALGLFYLSTGQAEKAAAEFQTLMASKPADETVKTYLVDALIALNRINDAEAVNEPILKSNPSDPHSLLSHGRILLALGKYQDAAMVLERATKADASSATAYYYLGVARRFLGLTGLAKAAFGQALALQPGMTDATLALAGLATKSGANDEAASLAGNALKAAPGSVAAYLASARAALATGDVHKGEGLLEEGLKRDPASLPGLAMLVKLYAEQGRSKDAVVRISSILAKQPQSAGLNLLMAVSYFDLKDLQRSEASVREAIALDARRAEAYALLADIDYAKGALDMAKSDLRVAIERNPRSVGSYLTLGAWCARDGNWDEARKLWERAHEIDPASPVAAGQLAFLYLEHGGDVNVALSLAQIAKRATPDSAPAADTLGWAYYKLGSAALAVPQLLQSVQKAPENPIYLYHLGLAYLAMGHSQSAKQCLQRALERTPNFVYAAHARDALRGIAASRN